MLNRRYLRIKAMQALYAFFQSGDQDMVAGEKELFRSISKIYDLYIYLLLLLPEIGDVAETLLEDRKNKRLPTKEDLNPNRKFIDNTFIKQLRENEQLQKEANARKINWQGESELIRKVFAQIVESDEYKAYMTNAESSYAEDADFWTSIYRKYIVEQELLHHFFEEKSIYWYDDIYLVHSVIVKTIKSFKEDAGSKNKLVALYKDEEEDKQFLVDLFRKTIMNDQKNTELIAEKTKNWEVDRIAMMDTLLMRMAITEMLNFPNIPVKVTLNEYIDISKLYSSPKSRIFINGILDKLVIDFRRQDLLRKTGRGLME